MRCASVLLVLSLLTAAVSAAQAPPPPSQPPYALSAEEKASLTADLTNLGKRLSLLRAKPHDAHLLADVEVYYKAVAWMLRFPEETYTRAYADNARMLVKRGIERIAELEQGRHEWTSRKGRRVVFGYRSRVDASVQPFHLTIPASHDASKPARLDVVLHGRGATLTEVSFLAQAEGPKPPPVTYEDRLELHLFGRTNNAYRWAGETDVFEALEATAARFKIDRARIVLRGFSMGGAGAWHIGFHFPDRWAAIEAGAGFNETRNYAKQSDPPPHHEKLWHIYDAFEYSRNAFNVPTVGYGGDQDPQLQASLNVQAQLKHEGLFGAPGLDALFLVGPQTGHRFHPASKKESDAFIDKFVAAGARGSRIPHIRFVTYTARYGKCDWITIEGLGRHYERAAIDAGDASGEIVTRNVTRLAVRRNGAINLDGTQFASGNGVFEKVGAGPWRKAPAAPAGAVLRKRPGLQGPIDDAFMDSFLVVRPTTPHAGMERFLNEFAKWMRGDPRTAEAAALTQAQIRDHNLILFGDAQSNAVIRRIESRLPMKVAANLAMIYPNPLNPARYVVINSGHTFGEREFKGTNALLFPRLGDWAILDGADGSLKETGFFDESWQRKP